MDSVRRNVRLDESLYKVGENGFPLVESDGSFMGLQSEKSCLPASYVEDRKSLDVRNKTWQLHGQAQKEYSDGLIFSKDYIYIDPDLSAELKNKVAVAAGKEGATILDHWYIGSPASHIVCENPSFQKYIGQANTLVTPLWVLKSVKEKCLQRLMHLSSDLVRQMAMVLESVQVDQTLQDGPPGIVCPAVLDSRNAHTYGIRKDTIEERQRNTELAKQGVRDRRSRRMQSCNLPLHPITPSGLLESLCWSVSEPPSSTRIYMEPLEMEDPSSVFYNARGVERDLEVAMEDFSRPLKESEKREVVFKGHFLTILFPIDRFGELGPSSRTFFSDCGFSCVQILDNIFNFYQENMSSNEVQVAIHTDSRHADRLRSVYSSKESLEQGYVQFRRIDFLGCRRCFEALRRIGGEHNSNCYELLLHA
ncbi:hypothetical protein HPP92_013024 [Vanilla planifolia]|uniref:BRCT domain-containing protein n=1 Tax=Vanilla planifolia TaxID=51239 RepID=A0A835UW96_VANPL|nr:hypothetical protein HPP92_013024 [Vanilla planifolia]